MCLVGNHSYCSQELVNLLLTGKASTNVFDGIRTFDDDDSQSRYILKGIQKQSRLGLLTLHEWNGYLGIVRCFGVEYLIRYVEVGSFLKCPEFPVWVICAESHFTVLFASKGVMPKVDEPFQLFYYDGLTSHHALSKFEAFFQGV